MSSHRQPRRSSQWSTQQARSSVARGAVRAYGEMVALLWDEGNATGALRLEELWDELQRETEFSLLCAYPEDALGGEADCARVHAAHTHVLA